MIPIESISNEQSNAMPRNMGVWHPAWTPLMAPPQEATPTALAKSGSAENNPKGNQEQKDEFGKDGREPAQVFISSNTKAEKSATYSPASLNATSKISADSGRSEEDEDFIKRLEERDQKVKTHEMAHAAALGPYAGGIQYTYQVGPDGRAYAVGGSTQVNMSRESDPAADFFKSQTIMRAAMAAGDPSNADMTVAAKAAQQAQNAARLLG